MSCSLRNSSVISDNHAATSRSYNFITIKGEAAHFAERACLFTLVFGAETLCSILDYFYIICLAYSRYLIHVSRVSEYMDRNDRSYPSACLFIIGMTIVTLFAFIGQKVIHFFEIHA